MIERIKSLIEKIPNDKVLHFSVGILLCININIIISIIFNNIDKITIAIISFITTFIILFIDEYYVQAKKPNRNSKDIKDLIAGTLGALTLTIFIIFMVLL